MRRSATEILYGSSTQFKIQSNRRSAKTELEVTLARQAEAPELDPLESPEFAHKQRIRSESS